VVTCRLAQRLPNDILSDGNGASWSDSVRSSSVHEADVLEWNGIN